MKMSKFPATGLSRALVGSLQPTAAAHHGQVMILSNPSGNEMTHQSVFGLTDSPLELMRELKRRFDPKNILNRGRFVV
jgi:FAD/FMN-containing dehydrogenase